MPRAVAQPSLFALPPSTPEGFEYRPHVISHAEQARLAARLEDLPFKPFEFHGFLGKRRTVSYGWRYDFSGAALIPADPIPEWLQSSRALAADFSRVTPGEVAQVLINQYPPGAPIGWHRDRPVFDKVVGISLLAPCVLRFRRREGSGWARSSCRLEPGSAYVLDGPARHVWEHSILPASELRYSLTFRTFSPSRQRTD